MNSSVTLEKKNMESDNMKTRNLWVEALMRLRKHKMACVGGAVILIIIAVAVFAPLLAPKHYAEGNFAGSYARPGKEYPLGADFMGRDLLSRLIYGARISLTVGFLGAFTASIIGISYGMIAGYFGGKVDNFMMRIVDIFYAFPSLLFIILLMVVFRSNVFQASHSNPLVSAFLRADDALGGLLLIVIGMSFTSWVGMARLARGLTMSVRQTEFIQSGLAVGSKTSRMIFKHVLPNIIGPCIVNVTLSIPTFISTEAFLSFIGLGINPPTPSWGIMISEGYSAMQSYPHIALFPGIALAITMLSFNFFGDGLRDALDPRMK